MPDDDPTSRPLDVLFAHALANQAVDYPDWTYDDHAHSLVAKGFTREMIAVNARAIAEAIHFAEKLRDEGRIAK